MRGALAGLLRHYGLPESVLDPPKSPHPIWVPGSDSRKAKFGEMAQVLAIEPSTFLRIHFLGAFQNAPAPFAAPPGERIRTGKKRRAWQVDNRADLLDHYGLAEIDLAEGEDKCQIYLSIEDEAFRVAKGLVPLYGVAGAGWLIKVHIVGGIATAPPIDPDAPDVEPERQRVTVPKLVR